MKTSDETQLAKRPSALVPLSTIKPRQVEWLWHQRIPLGELTVIDGDPSVNKSSVLIDLAARVSNGREMPDGTSGVAGTVILMLAEDSLDKTIVQRFLAAGANLKNISTIQEQVTLPDKLHLLEESILQAQAKLLLIDPLMAFLSCDANGDQKVRRALTPLKTVADKTNCAIVMVRHLTKTSGKNSLYRGSGSVGIIAATRSALLIGKSPDDPNFRVMCHTKNNLGPLAPSLLFEPVSKDGIVSIEWRGECEYRAEELLKPALNSDSKTSGAMSFLSDVLSHGPVEQKVIRRKAVSAGIALRTLERAKEILGVESKRSGFGPGSFFVWSLADDSPSLSANDEDLADNEPLIIRPSEFEHT